jgi:hypothetical protein
LKYRNFLGIVLCTVIGRASVVTNNLRATFHVAGARWEPYLRLGAQIRLLYWIILLYGVISLFSVLMYHFSASVCSIRGEGGKDRKARQDREETS